MGLFPNFIARRPFPAEYDLAGIIEDANDSAFSKGDRVFGWISPRGTLSLLISLSDSTESLSQVYRHVPAREPSSNMHVCQPQILQFVQTMSPPRRLLVSLWSARQYCRPCLIMVISSLINPFWSMEAAAQSARLLSRSPRRKAPDASLRLVLARM